MERTSRKVLSGVVTSDKMDKTIVVTVERKFKHPLYRKQIVSHKKFHAHDEKNEAKVGDQVKIVETRPLSKKKTFRLVKITEKAK